MNDVVREIDRYLDETLGEAACPRPWDRPERLPVFLRDRYEIYEGELFDTPLLFMVAKTPDEQTPAAVRKQIAQLQEKWPHAIVYVRQHVTAYNRRRLIQHRVPFIVPGKQMYLPLLGLDLRERFGTAPSKISTLSPSAQATLIYALLQEEDEQPWTAARLGPCLRYAPITMSRVFNELESAKLVECITAGRTRECRLRGTRPAVWRKAQPLLRSPVGRVHHVLGRARALRGLVAGLSALAQHSMLAEPSIPVVAVSRADWRSARQRGNIESVPMADAGTTEIQVWAYPPHTLSDGRLVDPLSLYLSVHGDPDERVSAALEEMLENLGW